MRFYLFIFFCESHLNFSISIIILVLNINSNPCPTPALGGGHWRPDYSNHFFNLCFTALCSIPLFVSSASRPASTFYLKYSSAMISCTEAVSGILWIIWITESFTVPIVIYFKIYLLLFYILLIFFSSALVSFQSSYINFI